MSICQYLTLVEASLKMRIPCLRAECTTACSHGTIKKLKSDT